MQRLVRLYMLPVLALAGLVLVPSAKADCPNCINTLDIQSSGISINYVQSAVGSTAPSMFTETLSGVSSGFLQNVAYNGWCIDNPDVPVGSPKRSFPATLTSSYSATAQAYVSSIPTLYPLIIPPPVPSPSVLAKINYLLNNKPLGAQWTDVQRAIWTLLGYSSSPTSGFNDTNFPPTLISQNMLTAANQYGGSFIPGPGQILGVMADPGPGAQHTLIETVAPACAVGDFVWSDTGLGSNTGNGFQDIGEPGINGVVVKLTDGVNTLQTTTTANAPAGYPNLLPGSAGYYQFNGLCSGVTYYVSIDNSQQALSGYWPTKFEASNTNTATNDSKGNGSPVPVTLPTPTGTIENIDFGYLAVTQLTVSCNPPAASFNTPYSYSILPSGGVTPYSFTPATGSLPPGMSLTTTGTSATIGGSATAFGTFNFSINVSDITGLATGQATATCSLVVNPPPINVSCGASTGQVGSLYSSAINVTGGTGTGYTYSVVSSDAQLGTPSFSGNTLSFTPTAAGSFSYVVKVTDSQTDIGLSHSCPVVVAPAPPINVTCGSSTAQVGSLYSSSASATGGAGALTLSLMSSTIPGTVSVTSGGAVSFTPTNYGDFSYTVQAKDTYGDTGSATCPVHVNPPPVQVTCGSTTAQVGSLYSSSVSAFGGTQTGFTFSLMSSTIPGTVTVSSGGAVSFTPTSYGDFGYTVQAKDSLNDTGTATCSVHVNASPLAVSCPTLTTGTVGVTYSSLSSSSGGTGGSTYSVTAGSLPTGVTLSSTGLLSGTPLVNGNFFYTIQAKDSSGTTATTSCSISIAPAPVAVQCAPATAGQVGTLYSSSITATGGTAPYMFAVTTGRLPPGLALNTGTGVISGIPTIAGSYSYTVTATDSTPGVHLTASTGSCGIAIGASLNICGLTWGYWKNHVSLWPITSLTLGAQTYSQTELQSLLKLAVAGDASINLAHQLIAAKFNVLHGTNGLTDGGAIAASDALLATFSGKLPYNVDASSTVGQQMTTIAGQLDTFNSDGAGQPGCMNGPSPLTLQCASGTGQMGVLYSSALTASGGLQPYTFSIIGGALPDGLTLDPATGAITGIPTKAGTFGFTAMVADATAGPGSTTGAVQINCSITIAAAPQLITVTCPAGAATAGAAYSSSMVASGGIAPYTYSVSAGSLPAGLKLDATKGTITGTPSKGGTYTFTLTAVDSKKSSGSSNCTIVVAGGIAAGQFTTYTQGGWGAPPKGNNPGALLTAKFATVYGTGGSVPVGGTYMLTFTSALSIINFLPQGSTPGALTASAPNPISSAAGVFAGQVLALQLNVDFSNKGILPTGLANLKVVSGLAAGLTVQQVLTIANSILGGVALPPGITVSDVNNVVDAINNNFDNGTKNNGYLQ